MVMDPNSTRKHHRVYAKKDSPKHNATQVAVNRRALLYGIVGLALVQGVFWGYMLGNKTQPSRKRRLF